MADTDTPPDWMVDHEVDDAPLDLDEHDPDENSLASILGRAVAEIAEVGGRDRHTLATTLGRQNYDKLIQKPAVANAIDNWLEASPKTKNAAGRMLAIQIAKVADEPKLVSRIENELRNAAVDYFAPLDRPGRPRSHPRKLKSEITAKPSIRGETVRG